MRNMNKISFNYTQHHVSLFHKHVCQITLVDYNKLLDLLFLLLRLVLCYS